MGAKPVEDFYYDIARQWMEDVMGEVTSADAAYAWLRDREITIPRSVVREVWREIGREIAWRPLIARLPSTFTVPRRMIVDIPTKSPNPYWLKIEVTGTTYEGVVGHEKTLSMPWYRQPTFEDVEEWIPPMLPRCDPEIVPETSTYKVLGVYHKRGTEW